jgi:hypothetical protein
VSKQEKDTPAKERKVEVSSLPECILLLVAKTLHAEKTPLAMKKSGMWKAKIKSCRSCGQDVCPTTIRMMSMVLRVSIVRFLFIRTVCGSRLPSYSCPDLERRRR